MKHYYDYVPVKFIEYKTNLSLTLDKKAIVNYSKINHNLLKVNTDYGYSYIVLYDEISANNLKDVEEVDYKVSDLYA